MKTKYSMLAGLMALLLPTVMRCRYFVPPDDAGGGGDDAAAAAAAAEGKEVQDPAMKMLFGIIEDGSEEQAAAAAAAGENDNEVVKNGMSLQEAMVVPTDEEKAAADAAAAEKIKTDAAAAAAAEAEKKKVAGGGEEEETIRVTKRTRQPSAADIAAEEARKTAEAATSAAAAEAGNFEKGLLDEEREELERARFAEKHNPTRYKGLAARTEKFLRDLKTKTDAEDFDPDSDEYKDWLRSSKPAMSTNEIIVLERERGAAQAREESRRGNADVLDKTFRQIQAPQVKAEADRFFEVSKTVVMPAEVLKVFAESPAKAKTEFPMEWDIVSRELNQHTEDIEELLMLTRRNADTGNTLKTFDDKNPQHARIYNLVYQVEGAFKKTADTVRDGRKFLARYELARVPEQDRSKYWTFTANEIASRSTALLKDKIAGEITKENKRLSDMGFERKKPAAAAAAPAAAKKAAASPPAPRPGQMPAGDGAGGAKTAGENLLAEMGIGSGT